MNLPGQSKPEIRRAADLLRQSLLVAFPTETVYGLGADATSSSALERLYAVKGRPSDHPVIVHLHSVSQLTDWAIEIPESAYALAEKFWPGPMTLILKRQKGVLDAVTGGQNTVGLRIPDHPLALELLREFGSGVAAPSANRFGKLSPTTAQAVREGLGDDVAMVLDGGDCQVGIESTIISLVGEPRVLRPGMLTKSDITRVIKLSDGRSEIRAPGTLDSHYAPETGVVVIEREKLEETLDKLLKSKRSYALMCFADTANVLGERHLPAGLVTVRRDNVDYARRLYQGLRDLDRLSCDFIVVESLPESAEWEGVLDRLTRSAHGTSID